MKRTDKLDRKHDLVAARALDARSLAAVQGGNLAAIATAAAQGALSGAAMSGDGGLTIYDMIDGYGD